MTAPRPLASWLMFLTGLAHVGNFVALGMSPAAVGLAVFGALYLVTGMALRGAGRAGPILGVLLPALGGAGGAAALADAFSPLMLAYVLVDLAVVALCVRVLLVGGAGGARAERGAAE